jgi:hypothetical protein
MPLPKVSAATLIWSSMVYAPGIWPVWMAFQANLLTNRPSLFFVFSFPIVNKTTISDGPGDGSLGFKHLLNYTHLG